MVVSTSSSTISPATSQSMVREKRRAVAASLSSSDIFIARKSATVVSLLAFTFFAGIVLGAQNHRIFGLSLPCHEKQYNVLAWRRLLDDILLLMTRGDAYAA